MIIDIPELHQWDVRKQITVDSTATWVDYDIQGIAGCIRVPVTGGRAYIPNIVLTRWGQLNVTVVRYNDQSGERWTIGKASTNVIRKEKDPDYVYSDEDYINWAWIRNHAVAEAQAVIDSAVGQIEVSRDAAIAEIGIFAGEKKNEVSQLASAAEQAASAAGIHSADAKLYSDIAKGNAERAMQARNEAQNFFNGSGLYYEEIEAMAANINGAIDTALEPVRRDVGELKADNVSIKQRLTAVENRPSGGGASTGDGLTDEQKSLIIRIMLKGAYTDDVSASIASLASSFGVEIPDAPGGGEQPDEPIEIPENEIRVIPWDTANEHKGSVGSSDGTINPSEESTWRYSDYMDIPDGAVFMSKQDTRSSDRLIYFYTADKTYLASYNNMGYFNAGVWTDEEMTPIPEQAKYYVVCLRAGTTLRSVTFHIYRRASDAYTADGRWYSPLSLGRKISGNNGDFYPDSPFSATEDYLLIRGAKRILTNSTGTEGIVLYDSNRQLIGEISPTVVGTSSGHNRVNTYTVPEDAVYGRYWKRQSTALTTRFMYEILTEIPEADADDGTA